MSESMPTKLPFAALPDDEKVRARARFFDARASDGYLYELDCDGHVLCRNRCNSDWIEGTPPAGIDFAWLRVLTDAECDDSAAHVILGLRDIDGVWCESGDYKGESTKDIVIETITHWMPHSVPVARIVGAEQGGNRQ